MSVPAARFSAKYLTAKSDTPETSDRSGAWRMSSAIPSRQSGWAGSVVCGSVVLSFSIVDFLSQ